MGVRDSIPRLAGDGVRESGDGVRESGDGVRVPAPRPRGPRGQSNLWPPLLKCENLGVQNRSENSAPLGSG